MKFRPDLGVALDGEADRAILLDLPRRSGGRRTDHAFMGLALKKEGIKLLRTSVGVRYVAECLRQEGLNSGGEKSRHLIFLDHAAT